MTRTWAASIVFFVVASALCADPKIPSKNRIPRSADFVKRVNEAIDRGVQWLKKNELPTGGYADYSGNEGATTALGYHTMRVCGVAQDDPAATMAWNALRRGYVKEKLRTYSASLHLMAIAEHGDRVPMANGDYDVRLSPEDKEWATEITRWLAGGQNEDGAWTYAGGESSATGSGAMGARVGSAYDHSNTQYALLGLKCASRCRVPIDASVWKKALLHFLTTQEAWGPDVPRFGAPAKKGVAVVDHARGWSYVAATRAPRAARGTAYSAMTAAGVSSVVICRSELLDKHDMSAKLETESEKSTWDGLAWLGTEWKPAVPVRRPSVLNLYEYYGVERAGVLAGVEWMADLDWYGKGAPAVLEAQLDDGSWTGTYAGFAPNERGRRPSRVGAGDVIDTCFALLFLKRGTTPVRRGAVTETTDDINYDQAEKLSAADFEDFVDIVLSRWRQTDSAAVKTRIFDGATSAGPRIVDSLFLRMDYPDVEVRAAAHALLVRATGVDFGYAADSPPERRESAVEKWHVWWIGAKEKCVYDPATKRLVVR